jgi:ABC-type multidrug transport system fused ATPase/permease subunit
MAVAGHKLKLFFALSIVMDILTVVFSVAAPALLKTLIDSYSDNLPSYNLAWVGAAYGLVWLASELMLRLRAVFSSILIEQVKKEASIRFCLNTIFI